jgi:hypothetical protein
MLFCLAALSSGFAFVVHIALRTKNIALGYEVERGRQDARRVRAEINRVRLELAVLRTPANLESAAQARGMVRPDAVPTVVVGGAVRPARLSGRAR